MYVDPNGNICFFGAVFVALIVIVVVVAVASMCINNEVDIAKSKYENNTVDKVITEESIIINEKNEIQNNNEIIGKVESEGNYVIYNSYSYNREDMLSICKVLAKHMGNEQDYGRLYNEWLSHNYGYYAFDNFGICGFLNWGYGIIKKKFQVLWMRVEM